MASSKTEMGIEGVSTVEGYRQHLIDQAAQRKRYERDHVVTQFVEKRVLAQSEFAPVDRGTAEYRACYEERLDQARQYAQDEGATELDILRQMLRQKKEAGEEEILAALAEDCDRQMKLLAIGRAHAAQDGVSFTLADCEADVRQFAEMRGVPYETMREQFAPESLLPGKYIGYYENKILAWCGERYTVTIAAQQPDR